MALFLTSLLLTFCEIQLWNREIGKRTSFRLGSQLHTDEENGLRGPVPIYILLLWWQVCWLVRSSINC